MVVDDDFLVRSNMNMMIQELSAHHDLIGLQVIGEASDGEEALNLLKIMMPDIIISDIQMPHVDGIKLQQSVKEMGHTIQFIMLSNYDDYDYVRETLRNGAVDYILKHKLSIDVLGLTIRRAISFMEETMNQSQSKEIPPEYSLVALKRDFILGLIAGFYQQIEELESRITVMGLPLNLNHVVAVIMTVQYEDNHAQNKYLLEKSILNIVDEILQEKECGICCNVTEDKYILLLSYKGNHSEHYRDQLNYELFSRISTCILKFLNLKVKLYKGEVVPRLTDIKKSFIIAEGKYRNRYYEGVEKEANLLDKPFDILTIFDSVTERKLMNYVRTSDQKGVDDTIHEVFVELCKWSPSLVESQIVFIDLISVLNRICKEKGMDVNKLYTENKTLQERFDDFTSITEARSWFLQLFHQVLADQGENRSQPVSEYISEAIGYIHKNYSDNISQTWVAEQIGISTVYLSKLFKDELQIGFMDYVTNYRLEKAKQLLDNHSLSNKKIAQLCGFNDDAYFSKVFKRLEGITPKEYQKRRLI